MKSFGIVLIVIGALAFVYSGFTYTRKEKVVDLGPLEINKDKQKTVSWPPYAGAVLCLAGIVLIVVDKKK